MWHTKKRARDKETRTKRQDTTPLSCLPRARPFSFSPTTSKRLLRRLWLSVKVRLGSVVRTPVSANPGLNFNPGFFFFLTCEPRDFFHLSQTESPFTGCFFSSKALSQIIFSILFRVSNHQIVGNENKLNLFFKLSYLSSIFALTLCYLNPASNNPAQL